MDAINFLASPSLAEIFDANNAPEIALLTEKEIDAFAPAFAVFCPNVFSGLNAESAWSRFEEMGE